MCNYKRDGKIPACDSHDRYHRFGFWTFTGWQEVTMVSAAVHSEPRLLDRMAFLPLDKPGRSHDRLPML